ADVPESVRSQAQSVFEMLGEAEAKVHDLPVAAVHFHEVGAADTIVDVTCAVLATHLLGVRRLCSSAVTVGGGTVHCEHGEMPVPAPGTLGNLFGIPVATGGPQHECTTPTGAALLKVLVDEFEPDITWVPESTGYGAGTRDIAGHPNLLRITTGRMHDVGTATALTEVTCNLDTLTGEGLAYVLDGLLQRGAADAFATPVVMKKGRPGYQVTALVARTGQDAVVQFLLEESSTLGVRMHRVEREVLERWQETVETDLGPVRCKVARLPSGRVMRRPEDSEVQRLVGEHGLGRQDLLGRLLKQLGG
ncbi:MAG: nickel pincer cofactor biosynthesis protein LarC, partial [Planctomycetota bacterium]